MLVAGLVVAYKKFEWFQTGVNFIVNAVIGLFENVVNGAIMMVNGIIRAYNAIPLAPNIDTIGHVDFGGIGQSANSAANKMKLPKMANGGIITSPQLVLAGESGPEAIVPLGKGGGMGGITINISGGLGTSTDIANAVYENLRFYNQNVGPLRIRTA